MLNTISSISCNNDGYHHAVNDVCKVDIILAISTLKNDENIRINTNKVNTNNSTALNTSNLTFELSAEYQNSLKELANWFDEKEKQNKTKWLNRLCFTRPFLVKEKLTEAKKELETCIAGGETVLNLSMMQLNSIPWVILQGVNQVNLSCNRLKRVPKNLLLMNLQHLDLSFNMIETLPTMLFNLPAGCEINLRGNPLKDGIEEIIKYEYRERKGQAPNIIINQGYFTP